MKIGEIGYKEKPSNFHGKHSHAHAELFYVDRGVLHLRFGQKTQIQLKQGDACIVPPNQSHSYWAQKGRGPNFFDIHFTSRITDLKDIYMIKFNLTDNERQIMRSLINECGKKDAETN